MIFAYVCILVLFALSHCGGTTVFVCLLFVYLLSLFSLTFCVIRFLCRAAAAAKGAGQREIGGGCGQLGHQGLDHVSPGRSLSGYCSCSLGKRWLEKLWNSGTLVTEVSTESV